MVFCWKRLFCGTHFSMISICQAESRFNDGTNEKYHLLIHHKKLEQLKKNWGWTAAAIKFTTKYKKQYQISISLRKKAISLTGVFSDKVINFTNELWMWRSFVKNYFVDDGDIKLVTSRFDRNTYCTVFRGNFVYSFSLLRNLKHTILFNYLCLCFNDLLTPKNSNL